jgi:hypothetical protein
MPPGSRVTRKSADPSPSVSPSRPALEGLVIPSESTWSAAKPFMVRPHRLSVAPAITASQTPSASSERAETSARAPEEQAVESV